MAGLKKSVQDLPEPAASTVQKPSLENLMKHQQSNSSLLKGAQSLFPNMPGSAVVLQESQAVGEKKSAVMDMSDIIVLSDSSDSPMKLASGQNSQMSSGQIGPAPPVKEMTPGQGSGTVKIRMGLLQAAKRLKPSTNDSRALAHNLSGDTDMSVDESSAMSDNENEAPLPSATDGGDNSLGGSSSGESSSSDSEESGESSSCSEDDKDDDENDGDDNSDDESNDGDGEMSDQDEKEKKEPKPAPKLKMKVVPTTEDEEESSDNAEEIDLISSEDEKDDAKDKDYNGSEDDDVIMISDDEYKPRGRAVIPSPPRQKDDQGVEILVRDVPNFDPIISSIMSDAFK